MSRKRVLSLLLCLSLLTGKTLGKEKPKVDEQQKSSVSLQYLKEGVCNTRTFFEFLLVCGLGYSYLNKGKSKKSFGSLNINNQSLTFNGTKPKKDNNIINKKINLKFDGIESKKSFGNLDINNQSLNFNGTKPKKAKDSLEVIKNQELEFFGSSFDPESLKLCRVLGVSRIFCEKIEEFGWEEVKEGDNFSFYVVDKGNLTPLFRRLYECEELKTNNGKLSFKDDDVVGEYRVCFSRPEMTASNYFGVDNFNLVSKWKKQFSEDGKVYLILEIYKSKNGSNARGENVKDKAFVVGYLANINVVHSGSAVS